MSTGTIAKKVLAVALPLGLLGATPLKKQNNCFLEGYDLWAMMSWKSDLTKFSVNFANKGQAPVPSYGFKLAIYRWLPGNKAYTTNYFSINAAGLVDSKFITVPSVACNTVPQYDFNLEPIKMQYWGQQVKIKLVYDRTIRDASMTNQFPEATLTLK